MPFAFRNVSIHASTDSLNSLAGRKASVRIAIKKCPTPRPSSRRGPGRYGTCGGTNGPNPAPLNIDETKSTREVRQNPLCAPRSVFPPKGTIAPPRANVVGSFVPSPIASCKTPSEILSPRCPISSSCSCEYAVVAKSIINGGLRSAGIAIAIGFAPNILLVLYTGATMGGALVKATPTISCSNACDT